MVKQAFGIVSLLDIEKNSIARLLWHRASEFVGKYRVETPKLPHFSWQVAVNYQIDGLLKALEKIATSFHPFKVSISGLGIFPGVQPILYLTIVRDATLNKIHEMVWEECSNYGIDLSPYYASDRWIPHITLVYNQLSPFLLSSIMEEIASESWEGEILIDSLAIAYQIGDDSGISHSLTFNPGIK